MAIISVPREEADHASSNRPVTYTLTVEWSDGGSELTFVCDSREDAQTEWRQCITTRERGLTAAYVTVHGPAGQYRIAEYYNPEEF